MSQISPFLENFNGHTRTSFKTVADGKGNYEHLPKTILTKRTDVVIYDAKSFLDLSLVGLRLLWWIWVSQKRDTDLIEMKPELVWSIPRSTFYKARKELLDFDMIAPSEEKHVYFTNLNIFFKGSIIKCYPDLQNIIIKNKWKEKE